jgi:hypothetical protein
MSINAFIEESAKEILREKIPGQGKVFIESLGEADVAGFAKAQVSAADTIIPENIKVEETILGVTGSYTGGGQGYNLTFKSEGSDDPKITCVAEMSQGEYENTEIYNNQIIKTLDITHPQRDFEYSYTIGGLPPFPPQTITVQVRAGDLDKIILYPGLPRDSFKVLFTGKYDGVEYNKYELSFNGITLYPPEGLEKWNINKFESNCLIEVIKNA